MIFSFNYQCYSFSKRNCNARIKDYFNPFFNDQIAVWLCVCFCTLSIIWRLCESSIFNSNYIKSNENIQIAAVSDVFTIVYFAQEMNTLFRRLFSMFLRAEIINKNLSWFYRVLCYFYLLFQFVFYHFLSEKNKKIFSS